MARVRINTAQARVVSIEAGVRLVGRVLLEVESEAKLITSHGPYATGRLATSIRHEGPNVVGDRVLGRVGSDLPYAASVHGGAGVHPIFPKGARGVYRFGRFTGRPKLRFFWRKVGQMVFLPQVPGSRAKIGRSHPGQAGKHYLTEPLRDAARRHQMRVITTDI